MTFRLGLSLLGMLLPAFLWISASQANPYIVVKDEQQLPVVGAREFDPLVDISGERVAIEKAHLEFDKSQKAKSSEFEIEIREIVWLINQLRTESYETKLALKTEKEIKGAYCVARSSKSSRRDDPMLIFELPTLYPDKDNLVELKIPIHEPMVVPPKLHFQIMVNGESVKLAKAKGSGNRELTLKNKATSAEIRVKVGKALPKVLFLVRPELPKKLIRQTDNAYVELEFFVEKDGSVSEAKAIRFSDENFVKPAIDAITRSIFRPAIWNGEDVRAPFRHKFGFYKE